MTSMTRNQLYLLARAAAKGGAFKIEFSADPEETMARAFAELKDKVNYKSGDKVVVISDLLIDKDSVGIQIRYLP